MDYKNAGIKKILAFFYALRRWFLSIFDKRFIFLFLSKHYKLLLILIIILFGDYK